MTDVVYCHNHFCKLKAKVYVTLYLNFTSKYSIKDIFEHILKNPTDHTQSYYYLGKSLVTVKLLNWSSGNGTIQGQQHLGTEETKRKSKGI